MYINLKNLITPEIQNSSGVTPEIPRNQNSSGVTPRSKNFFFPEKYTNFSWNLDTLVYVI